MAAIGMDIQLNGAPELVNKLNRVDAAVRNAVSVNAVRSAGEYLVVPIRARAPVRTGGLASSTDTVVRHYRQSGVSVAITGPSYPRGRHGSIIEGGTVQRRTHRGANRGIVQPDPFVDPVFQANKAAVLGIVTQELKHGIEAEVT